MDLTHELQEILAKRRLRPLFQPLVNLRERRIFGYEALIRGPSDSPLHGPLNLFDAATRAGRLAEVELLAREISVEQFRRLSLPERLFLNISPECLLSPGFKGGRTLAMIRAAGIDPSRVVIELTEHQPTHDLELMKRAIEHYRAMGFTIAIDDLGAGYSGLRLWCDLRPDYVKIDRHFIQGIHDDTAKQAFVRSIRDIARSLDCRVIAEGVECREERETVEGLGITLAQGFYFSPPRTVPPTQLSDQLYATVRREESGAADGLAVEPVSVLSEEAPAVPPTMRVDEVGEYFVASPTLHSIAVVEGGIPIGIVRRHNFMNTFLSRYGRDLHGRRPIIALMESEPLVFSHDTPLEEVSRVVTASAGIQPDHDFIITRERRYSGVGRVIELLRKITDQQIRFARYANPLTQLPGNVPINNHLSDLLKREESFVTVYVDLDHFKPFNDHYGYAKGDEVIQLVAEVLREQAVRGVDFVGHVGGDDFVVVFRSDDWEARCRSILALFEARAPIFYTPEERERGGVFSHDRAGNDCFFPLISLSLAAVQPDPLRCRTFHDVAALAAGAKHEAKKMAGNSLFVERRRGPGPGKGELGQWDSLGTEVAAIPPAGGAAVRPS
ncbi:GGDEF domain-containing protein [Endothiovibrio diazotrophicus]